MIEILGWLAFPIAFISLPRARGPRLYFCQGAGAIDSRVGRVDARELPSGAL